MHYELTKCFDRIWASFIFFTRLPLWRLHEPRTECYKTVVEHWPLTGWLTGGLMAATLYAGSLFLPYLVAVLLAIAVRMLTTGALHEDGLADFFDGFGGGGNDRERILTIMKDSHIGTYGVIALIGYFTKTDLTSMGKILMMALIGIIIASIVNIFTKSEGLTVILNYLGVLVFVGLTAYDSQKIKKMLMMAPDAGETAQKLALLGALSLYLDFINLFIYLLRILGTRRD